MREQQRLLSLAQKDLVNELVATYGIEPEDITFFPDEARPFLSYEATCVLANTLTDIKGINIEPIEGTFIDSLSLKCTLTFADGRTRSAVGVANVSEQVAGNVMNSLQLYQTASSRAIRNALRTAAIDLIKLHEQVRTGSGSDRVPEKSNRNSLLSQVHALGEEAGLIVRYTDGPDKTAWRAFLQKRYVVASATLLTEEALADLAAVLRTITAPLSGSQISNVRSQMPANVAA
jgi:hypothetical protein